MDLPVETRKKFGKANKGLRREGVIPAELYGHGVENLHLEVKTKDFERVYKAAGENTVINLLIGKEKKPVLVHDIDRDYLSGSVSHVDFYQIRMDEKIKVPVPVAFSGEAPAVKEKGGLLNKTILEIEVEALPANLPHSFEVDVSALDEFGKSIYVRDLKVPAEVRVITDPNTAIVTAIPPVKEEEVPAPVDISEVKVETEEKKAERASEKAEAEKTEG
jgi:large subunit ribosomal protein L25